MMPGQTGSFKVRLVNGTKCIPLLFRFRREEAMDFLVMSQNKKFYQYPPHFHEFWEILLNMEGAGTALVDGQEYAFGPGTIFCIRPECVHSKQSEEGFVDGSILVRDFCFAGEEEKVLVFEDDERSSFYLLFRLAYEYPMNPATDVYGERFLRSILDAMQNLLCHWRNDTCKNPDVLYVQKVLAEHVADPDFKLDALLEGLSYSPNHFRALFKEQCGCAPLQYYNQLKIQLARQQILQNKSIMTISEIAARCGFSDPYYFSRMFKKHTGTSPMQYYKNSKAAIPGEVERRKETPGCHFR